MFVCFLRVSTDGKNNLSLETTFTKRAPGSFSFLAEYFDTRCGGKEDHYLLVVYTQCERSLSLIPTFVPGIAFKPVPLCCPALEFSALGCGVHWCVRYEEFVL